MPVRKPPAAKPARPRLPRVRARPTATAKPAKPLAKPASPPRRAQPPPAKPHTKPPAKPQARPPAKPQAKPAPAKAPPRPPEPVLQPAVRLAGGPIDFDQLAEGIALAAARWVDLDHAWRVLLATKDIVKAQLMVRMRGVQGGSQRLLEQTVIASPEWQEFVMAEVEARTRATEAQLALKLAQTHYDGGRSANAARNAEIKHLGG